MTLATVIAAILMLSGAFFLLTGTLGFLRLPDIFTRMHAIGKSDTLGALLSLLGVACYIGWSLLALKVVAVAFFVCVANPTATHALSRAALLAGVQPWQKNDGQRAGDA
jgi:multicomponent Na+:H+ antiporter subunit G